MFYKKKKKKSKTVRLDKTSHLGKLNKQIKIRKGYWHLSLVTGQNSFGKTGKG